MPSYVLPQVLVFQEFAEANAATAQPLLACIVGEQYDLHRYSDADEKPGIKVTNAYDPNSEECFVWPGRAAGGVVDQDYTKVFIDDALLQYFNDPVGSGSSITYVTPGKNRIRAASKVFQTANGYTRSAELLRDVKIGDVIKIVASACGDPVTFWSQIVGLVADVVPAIVAAATSDIDNQAATILAASFAQTGGITNLVDIASASGTAYDGLADGNPEETYTVEVIGASVGGDATTAILKVTSASGNDDQAAVTPAAFSSPTAIGTRGLTVTWDDVSGSSSSGEADPTDFRIGQKWTITVSQVYNPPALASGGTYSGIQNTTYVAEVSRGGLFAGVEKPLVLVTTTTGIDVSGPTQVTGSGVDVPVGTLGATINFVGAALNKGDKFYVGVTAAAPGAVRTLLLANNLSDSLRGICEVVGSSSSSSSSSGSPPDLDVTLFIKSDIQVPHLRTGLIENWSQSVTELCMQAGITAFNSEWASGGALVALPVMAGAVYVEHRDRVATACATVGTVAEVTNVASILGVVHPDNPLAYGVYKALLNSNGQEVKYVGVCGQTYELDLEDWLEALDKLVGRDDVYQVVALTQELNIHQAVLALCDAQSTAEKGRWKIGWMNLAASEVIGIYTALPSGSPVLATITDDPDTSGTQYTIVEVTNGEFITQGVRAGDMVRALYTSDGMGGIAYSEFVVDAVINEESLRLLTGPAAAVNTPSKIEIWRTLTKTELAAEQATKPGLFSSRRAYLVWPDQLSDSGMTVKGYFLCAALAGLRSGVLPQQGLTNVEIIGFDDLSRVDPFFSANQLDTLAASGYWIVIQDNNDGSVYTRHQLSTGNQDSLFEKEQNITTNLDEISMLFLARMKQFIGRGNVTPAMIDIIRGEILAQVASLKNTITVARLGPQVIDAEILELRVHPTLRDRVLARIALELPFPLNNIELHLIAV
jgi:hypothetical protein